MGDVQWIEMECFLSFASSFSLAGRIVALHLHILMPIHLVESSSSGGMDGQVQQASQAVLRRSPPHHQEKVCGGSNKSEETRVIVYRLKCQISKSSQTELFHETK